MTPSSMYTPLKADVGPADEIQAVERLSLASLLHPERQQQ